MKILSLDTALSACTVACVQVDGGDANVLGEARREMPRGHAEALAPMIADVMETSALALKTLDRIAVTIGPGSFTGLRVGLAMARGLGLALDKPVIGIGTLHALARDFCDYAAENTSPFAVLLDARRGQLYMQAFDKSGAPVSSPEALDVDDVGTRHIDSKTKLVGPGASLLGDQLKLGFAHAGISALPYASGPTGLGIARLAAPADLPKAPPAPLYLRQADAKQQEGKQVARQ